mgnify:CR=1 FL=1
MDRSAPRPAHGILQGCQILLLPGLAEELLETIGLFFHRIRGGLAISAVVVGALLGLFIVAMWPSIATWLPGLEYVR